MNHISNGRPAPSSGPTPVCVRSWLWASALNARLSAKAVEASADVVAFDLEDAVLPHLKAQARETVVECLGTRRTIATAVRINPLGTLEGLRDLVRLVETRRMPDILVLSKPDLRAHLEIASAVLDEAGLAVRLYPTIESPRALWELARIDSGPPMLSGVVFGSADFSSEMGVEQGEADLRHVRREIALHSQRLGIAAVDAPCFAVGDDQAMARECLDARRLGYIGKVAIHPSQVDPINRAFTPSTEQAQLARALLEASESQAQSATFLFRDRMVGPPFVKHARRVCAHFDALNERIR